MGRENYKKDREGSGVGRQVRMRKAPFSSRNIFNSI